MRAKQIHITDPSALIHDYTDHSLPRGMKLRATHFLRHVQYVLWKPTNLGYSRPVFRALYQLDNDELTDVRTTPSERNKGYASICIGIILRVDGPSLIRAGPSPDSPVGFHKLLRFYSSFPGYYAVPGTNKVLRLMEDTRIEEAADIGFGAKPLSIMQIATLQENSKELKRLQDILRPLNEEEIKGLIDAQATDKLSLQSAMDMYDRAFFDSRPWGRAERVMFAMGMNNLVNKYLGCTYSLWDDIIAEESI